jgi:hypothetical protein
MDQVALKCIENGQELRLRLRLYRKFTDQNMLIDFLEDAKKNGTAIQTVAFHLMLEGYRSLQGGNAGEWGSMKASSVVAPSSPRRRPGLPRNKGIITGADLEVPPGNITDGTKIPPSVLSVEETKPTLPGSGPSTALEGKPVRQDLPAIQARDDTQPSQVTDNATAQPNIQPPKRIPSSADEAKFLSLFAFEMPAVAPTT